MFHDYLVDLFGSLGVNDYERKAMEEHHIISTYSKIHISDAWRNSSNILCVAYDDGKIFNYKSGCY